MAARATASRIRLAWVGVIVAAVVGLLVGNAHATHSIAGRAAGVWFGPPAVGDCLDILVHGHAASGGAGGADAATVVPCASPHDAEVTDAFGPRDPASRTLDSEMSTTCPDAQRRYVGPRSLPPPVAGLPKWTSPSIQAASTVVTAPPDQRTGPFHWSACVVLPGLPAGYTGSVRHATPATVPAPYRTCFGTGGPAERVSCAGPHTGEILARRAPTDDDLAQLGWDLGHDSTGVSVGPHDPERPAKDLIAAMKQFAGELDDECHRIAAAVLDTDDPTYDGSLVVTTQPDLPYANDFPDREHGDASLALLNNAAYCVVGAPNGGTLTGSVAGQGDTPPAVARP